MRGVLASAFQSVASQYRSNTAPVRFQLERCHQSFPTSLHAFESSNLCVWHAAMSSVKCGTGNEAFANLIRNPMLPACRLLMDLDPGLEHRLDG
jgi:hypothetical protein